MRRGVRGSGWLRSLYERRVIVDDEPVVATLFKNESCLTVRGTRNPIHGSSEFPLITSPGEVAIRRDADEGIAAFHANLLEARAL